MFIIRDIAYIRFPDATKQRSIDENKLDILTHSDSVAHIFEARSASFRILPDRAPAVHSAIVIVMKGKLAERMNIIFDPIGVFGELREITVLVSLDLFN